MKRLNIDMPCICLTLLTLSNVVRSEESKPVVGAGTVTAAVQQKGIVRIIARLTAQLSDLKTTSSEFLNVSVLSVTNAMRAAGVADVKQLDHLPFVVLEVNEAQLAALLRTGQIAAVQLDEPVPANLAESGPLIGAPQAWAAGARGAGWAIAILDTGVQTDHPFIAGRIVAEACFSTTNAGNPLPLFVRTAAVRSWELVPEPTARLLDATTARTWLALLLDVHTPVDRPLAE